MEKILVIQTAFLGDVVLATALLEKLHAHFPKAELDILVRKGNESLLDGHPFLNEIIIWNKKEKKYRGLVYILKKTRKRKYDLTVNLQRFFSTGFLTAFSGAKHKVGFSKNPLSFLFSKRCPHQFGTAEKPIHEIDRNLNLISHWTDERAVRPKLYPPAHLPGPFFPKKKYITISPASVWFTKQYPPEKWIQFLDRVGQGFHVYLLGGKNETQLCESIKSATVHPHVEIKAGQLSLLESAALMKKAAMNFTNDSAPAHMASAVNAPVTTIFCSTVPRFGFGPLSDDSLTVETSEDLDCRPCGLHGKERCPRGHFKCAELNLEALLSRLP